MKSNSRPEGGRLSRCDSAIYFGADAVNART